MLSSTKISHILSSELLGDPELADYWMREYVNDPTFLIGTATTEPVSGSENQLPYNGADGGYQTTAVLDGDNYIVNGKKHFISNVGWARLMFTFVRTNPDAGVEQGASLLMVPMDAPGVKMGGSISQLLTELHVACLPRHLPEQIEVDLSEVELEAMLHISDLSLPREVSVNERVHGTADHPVVSIQLRRVAQVDEEEELEEELPEDEVAAETPADDKSDGKD